MPLAPGDRPPHPTVTGETPVNAVPKVDVVTPEMPPGLVSMTGLGYGARNVNKKGEALQCHFLGFVHALLPVKAAREAFELLSQLDGADGVLKAVALLAQPRRAIVDLRDLEERLTALNVFPADWWDQRRDAVDTALFLLDAVEQHNGRELTSFFLGRRQMVRVPLGDGCA
jgi:hypothetical protein